MTPSSSSQNKGEKKVFEGKYSMQPVYIKKKTKKQKQATATQQKNNKTNKTQNEQKKPHTLSSTYGKAALWDFLMFFLWIVNYL